MRVTMPPRLSPVGSGTTGTGSRQTAEALQERLRVVLLLLLGPLLLLTCVQAQCCTLKALKPCSRACNLTHVSARLCCISLTVPNSKVRQRQNLS